MSMCIAGNVTIRPIESDKLDKTLTDPGMRFMLFSPYRSHAREEKFCP